MHVSALHLMPDDIKYAMFYKRTSTLTTFSFPHLSNPGAALIVAIKNIEQVVFYSLWPIPKFKSLRYDNPDTLSCLV